MISDTYDSRDTEVPPAQEEIDEIVDDYLDSLGDGEFVEAEERDLDQGEIAAMSLLEARDTHLRIECGLLSIHSRRSSSL